LASPAAQPDARAFAHWALGLVARERDQLADARNELETAIKLARQANAPLVVARVQSSLALVLAYLGDNEAALAATAAAAKVLHGRDGARNRMQEGLIRQRSGDFVNALGAYRSALQGLKRSKDRIGEVRVRLNRSVIHAYRGDLNLALVDLEAAIAIARRQRQALQVAACAHNLGWVHGRLGEIPRALHMFDVAEKSYLEVEAGGGRPAVLAIDRAEVLATAGMLDEAWDQVSEATAALSAAGNVVDLAEAKLLASRLALAKGDFANSRVLAKDALAAFTQQNRQSWVLQAEWLIFRNGLEEATPPELVEGETLVGALEAKGWHSEAVQARFETGRLALANGNEQLGRRMLEVLARTRQAPALANAQARHAEALLALVDGNPKSAKAALRRGLTSLVEHRATFGSAELRAQASAASRSLAELAVELALDSNQPWEVLTAIEGWRAISTQIPPARPPRDRELAESLAALRRLDAEIAESYSLSSSTPNLLAKRAALERSVRARAQQAPGRRLQYRARLDRHELRDRLGSSALLSFFNVGGSLGVVTVSKGKIRTARVGPLEPIARDVLSMRFALNRLSLGRSSDATLEAASAMLAGLGRSVSARLLEDLEDVDIGDGPLVIVPTGALHRLPWLALPALRGRPIVVAPSVTAWMAANARLRTLSRASRAVFAAGPGLPGAVREVRLLARRYEHRELLTGRRATGMALKAALVGCQIAHVGAHGSFRSDNPMFSALNMSDGALTIYDLEGVRSTPQLMVLPACDIGMSKVYTGDELLGLATALLLLGSASLVAPLVPIPDGATTELMLKFHGFLLKGVEPSEALARAASQGEATSPDQVAARSAFLVLGA
jgi:tetratricopeptide (TPR) repeat protein